MAGVGDKMVELFTDMNRQLGEMTAEIRSVLARLEKGDRKLEEHESRIDALEKKSHADAAVAKSDGNGLLRLALETIVKWGGWAILLLIGIASKFTGIANPAAN